MTKQSFKDECDINRIVNQFLETGQLPEGKLTPYYLDLVGVDYQNFMNFVADANELYDSLPGAIKDRFGRDQAAFVAFATDPANAPELARMGLVEPETARQGEALTQSGQKLPSDPGKESGQTAENKDLKVQKVAPT